MSGHRWCSFCTHSFSEDDLAEDDFGLPACPYCGAPGMYLRAWTALRALFPQLPIEPVDGERYRLSDVADESLYAAPDVGERKPPVERDPSVI